MSYQKRITQLEFAKEFTKNIPLTEGTLELIHDLIPEDE